MNFTVAQTKIPVLGGGEFPVRRIYCVGRNYRAHAVEMGGDPDRELPFFFQKPADAIVLDGATIPYPPLTEAFDHEIEMVVALGQGGQNVTVTEAPGLIFGYAVGLDLTRRDLQGVLRKAGRPWDMAKGFDHSAPISPITPISQSGEINTGAIWLKINGEIRQSSDVSQLIWSVAETIADLSRYMLLQPGDLIYSGTPDKVGPIKRGDRLHGHVDGLTDLHITIAD